MTASHRLEPLLPSPLPSPLLASAHQLIELSLQFSTLSANQLEVFSSVALISDAYHSLCIEKIDAQFLLLIDVCNNPSYKSNDLAVLNLNAQLSLRNHCLNDKAKGWGWFFSPKTIALLHRRLFSKATPADLHVGNGWFMVPGEMRSKSERNVRVGKHTPPTWELVASMLRQLQFVYGTARQPHEQLIAALAYHHRLAYIHPFEDGNGRVGRLATHLQLCRLGLNANLWSLSRGLAHRRDEYYTRLHDADLAPQGGLDERGQLSEAALVEFIAFMLEVCREEIQFSLDLVANTDETLTIEGLLAKHPEIVLISPSPR